MKNKIKTLNEEKTKKIGKVFSNFVLILLMIGIISLLSASYVTSFYQFGNSWFFVTRQLFFVIIGVTAMFVVANIDYKILFHFAEIIYGITVLLLCVVLLMPRINGARRWILFGIISFQPSEIAKLAIIIIFAKFITINENKMKTFKFGVYKLMIFMLIIAGLMILEPHISGIALVFFIGTIMMFVGGTNLFWFAIGGIFIIFLILIAIFTPGITNYAISRVTNWMNPFADPQGKGYQTIQSLYAISTGGIFGVGIGNSKQKQLYLPEPQNDFIFAIVCEEIGFFGATLIIILFGALFYEGVKIAEKTNDKFGFMLVVGIIAQLVLQLLLNLSVITNMLPNSGISMPFFSYGGTSITMLLAEIGIILSVNKFGNHKRIYVV